MKETVSEDFFYCTDKKKKRKEKGENAGGNVSKLHTSVLKNKWKCRSFFFFSFTVFPFFSLKCFFIRVLIRRKL